MKSEWQACQLASSPLDEGRTRLGVMWIARGQKGRAWFVGKHPRHLQIGLFQVDVDLGCRVMWLKHLLLLSLGARFVLRWPLSALFSESGKRPLYWRPVVCGGDAPQDQHRSYTRPTRNVEQEHAIFDLAKLCKAVSSCWLILVLCQLCL